MKRRYKVKETNKTKLKTFLKGKNNNKNERSSRHSTSSPR
tara:strand:+ start:897 stop:1016 length:120 start_codon:yes stop_codon:yes gene_type:complete